MFIFFRNLLNSKLFLLSAFIFFIFLGILVSPILFVVALTFGLISNHRFHDWNRYKESPTEYVELKGLQEFQKDKHNPMPILYPKNKLFKYENSFS